MKMKDICPLMDEWRSTTLYLDQNNQSFLKEIQDIKFPMLDFIDISCNRIGSVEVFNRIFIPSLQNLYLSNTPIKQ